MTETTDDQLTEPELEALHVLAAGMASRATTTVDDPERGLRGVNGRAANELVRRGYAREVASWRAVEITDAGRAALIGTV
jgi:hypothetical protein